MIDPRILRGFMLTSVSPDFMYNESLSSIDLYFVGLKRITFITWCRNHFSPRYLEHMD